MSDFSYVIIEVILVSTAVFIAFKCIDIVYKKFQNKILLKQEDTTILGFIPIVDKLLKFIILFLALATILQSHGYSITSIIAGFGVTGLAVGFGAQVTIANLFGSFAFLADKAFKIGDYIVINQSIQDKSVEGFVEDINLRSTKIRGSDGCLIIVPNNIVANGVVKNVKLKNKKKIMNIKIIALGKIKEKFLKDGINEFLKRLTLYACVEIVELNPIEIKDENLTGKVLDQEGEKILALIKQTSFMITLEIGGKVFSSEDFSKKIEEISNFGYNEIIFVIGSSCGLSQAVSKRANLKLSLSKMTFLHQFARLLLIEQIYRAFKIQKGETYHK